MLELAARADGADALELHWCRVGGLTVAWWADEHGRLARERTGRIGVGWYAVYRGGVHDQI
jgi:hypothetical protein